MSSSKWETKRILITVKAYPQPSRRYGEAVYYNWRNEIVLYTALLAAQYGLINL